MSFYSIKGSYLADLIHELTTIELDVSDYSRNGTKLDEPVVRASRYNRKSEQGKEYDEYVINLYQQSFTELAFSTESEAQRLMDRFEVLQLNYDKAFKIIDKYKELSYQNKFKFKDFEKEFYFLFNMRHDILSQHKSDVNITLLYDLFDAISSKEMALYWIKKTIGRLYFPDKVSIEEVETDLQSIQEKRLSQKEFITTPFISNVTKEMILNKLKPFVDDRVDDLNDIIKGIAIASPLIIRCRQSDLCRIIREIRKKDPTLVGAECAKWFCLHFRRVPTSKLKAEFSLMTFKRNI